MAFLRGLRARLRPPVRRLMLSWKRLSLVTALGIGTVIGQPTLTTIQDTLFRADGTRFTGTVYITYNSFQTDDSSNIAAANLTLPIGTGRFAFALRRLRQQPREHSTRLPTTAEV